MPKGSEFLKNSFVQIGPFVKVQIHVESRSQSSTRPPSSPGWCSLTTRNVTDSFSTHNNVCFWLRVCACKIAMCFVILTSVKMGRYRMANHVRLAVVAANQRITQLYHNSFIFQILMCIFKGTYHFPTFNDIFLCKFSYVRYPVSFCSSHHTKLERRAQKTNRSSQSPSFTPKGTACKLDARPSFTARN